MARPSDCSPSVVSAVFMLGLTVYSVCIITVSGQFTTTTPCLGSNCTTNGTVIPGRNVTASFCPGSNCTMNVCASRGLSCCQCKVLASQFTEVCACCPAGHFCCQGNASTLSPKCCPIGWQCVNGSCTTLFNPAPPRTLCSACDRMYLSITADDSIDELYLDGVSYYSLLTMPNYWNNVRTLEIPADTKVIATKCSDSTGEEAGLLASTTNDYLMTNASWKCTTKKYRNWMLPNFDDFSSPTVAWPNAVMDSLNGWPNGPELPPISPAAGWIWTGNYTDPIIDSPVYCRGHFPSTSGCDVRYGNCTNLCVHRQATCCGCELSGFGPTLVCNCCPNGHKCCPSPKGPTCCRNDYTCAPNGLCLIVSGMVPARISCGSGTCTGG